MKKIVIAMISIIGLSLLTGCTSAETVSSNISRESDVSRYDYEFIFRPEAIVPIEIKTQRGEN